MREQRDGMGEVTEIRQLLDSIREAIEAHGRQHGAQSGTLSASSARNVEGDAAMLPRRNISAVDELLEDDDALEWGETGGEADTVFTGGAGAAGHAGLDSGDIADFRSAGMTKTVVRHDEHGDDDQSAALDVVPGDDSMQRMQAGEDRAMHALARQNGDEQNGDGEDEGGAAERVVSNTFASVPGDVPGDAAMHVRAEGVMRASMVSPLFPVAASSAADREVAAALAESAAVTESDGADAAVREAAPASGARVVAMPTISGAERRTTVPAQDDDPVSGAALPMNGALALRPRTSSPGDPAKVHSLLSEKARRKVRSALDRLDRLEQAKAALGGEEALRQLVNDLLEPMLSRWLEENLPRMVQERLQAELDNLRRR